MDLALLDRVAQRAHDVLLADDVVERARAVAAVQRGAGGHGRASLAEGARGQLRLELAQSPVNAAFDGRERLAEDLGDLRDGELGAEAQRDRLALLGRSTSPARGRARRGDGWRRGGRSAHARPLGALERPRLRRHPPAWSRSTLSAIAYSHVFCDARRRSNLPRPRSARSNRVGKQVLGQRPVAGPVREEREEAGRLSLVQLLELVVAHESEIFCQESAASFVQGCDDRGRRRHFAPQGQPPRGDPAGAGSDQAACPPESRRNPHGGNKT